MGSGEEERTKVVVCRENSFFSLKILFWAQVTMQDGEGGDFGGREGDGTSWLGCVVGESVMCWSLHGLVKPHDLKVAWLDLLGWVCVYQHVE